MLARSKLNSIEALISQTLKNSEISHEDFTKMFKDKEQNYRRVKRRYQNDKKSKKQY